MSDLRAAIRSASGRVLRRALRRHTRATRHSRSSTPASRVCPDVGMELGISGAWHLESVAPGHRRVVRSTPGDGGELLRDGAGASTSGATRVVFTRVETCGPVKRRRIRGAGLSSQLRRATLLSRAGGASRLPTAARGVGGALSVDDARPGQPWSSTRPCSCATLQVLHAIDHPLPSVQLHARRLIRTTSSAAHSCCAAPSTLSVPSRFARAHRPRCDLRHALLLRRWRGPRDLSLSR